MPLMNGDRDQSSYNAIYGCYMDLQRMIREDQFKLIVYPKAGKIRLYDLKTDPLELNDIAEEQENAERVKEMFGHLLELSKQMGDTLLLGDYFPEL